MLVRSGHSVTGIGRDIEYGHRILPQITWEKGELRSLTKPENWSGFLIGCDTVVNASGALQSGLRDNVVQVQFDAIFALIEASARAGIKQFVQISASNAELGQVSEFMASKARADLCLSASEMAHTILRPGLVIGRNAFGGTELVRSAAALPVVLAAPAGTGSIQCVAMSDLMDAVREAVENPELCQGSYDLVDGEAHDLISILAKHRRWLGFANTKRHILVPGWIMRLAALLADGLGWLGWRSPLRSNSIAALMAGVSGDTAQTEKLIGRRPLNLDENLAAISPAGKADRWHARLALIYPFALMALIVLWMGSGVIGLAKAHDAETLISGSLGPGVARLLVLSGSAADILVAVGLICRPSLKIALFASIIMTIFYWLGSAFIRPDLWVDPLAPMLKTIPAIMLSFVCLAVADER
jgi:uncharacterized protein YbjT (DUF2867 family)